jgi:hypothetical protein
MRSHGGNSELVPFARSVRTSPLGLTMTNTERFDFGLKRVIDALDRDDEKTALSLYRAIKEYRPRRTYITMIDPRSIDARAWACDATT